MIARGVGIQAHLPTVALTLGLLLFVFLFVFTQLDRLEGSAWVSDPLQDYLSGFSWALLLGVTLLLWNRQERGFLLVLWFSRVIVTCLVMPFYEGYYDTLDAYTYHGYAVSGGLPNEYADSWLGTAFVFRLSQVLTWLTGSSFRALLVVYSYLGMLGTWLFTRAIRETLPSVSAAACYALALFPSVVFWSSIIGKEPLCFLGVGGAAWAFARTLRQASKKYMLLYVLCGLVLGAVRPWWTLILGGALLVGAVLCPRLRSRGVLGAPLVLGLVGAWAVAEQMRVHDLESALGLVEGYSRGVESGGSSLTAPEITSLIDLILFLPVSVGTALFRPFPWEAHNAFALLVSCENILLAVLIAQALPWGWRACRRHPFMAWNVGCFLIWLLLYGAFAYHNLGTTARYRSVALLFVLALAYFSRRVVQGPPAPVASESHAARHPPSPVVRSRA